MSDKFIEYLNMVEDDVKVGKFFGLYASDTPSAREYIIKAIRGKYLALHPPVKEPKDYLGKWFVRNDDNSMKFCITAYDSETFYGVSFLVFSRMPISDSESIEGFDDNFTECEAPELGDHIRILGVNI